MRRFPSTIWWISGSTIAGIVIAFCVGAPINRAPSSEGPHVVAGYGSVPLSFEVNEGQTNPQVRFLSRSRQHTLFLTSTEAVLKLHDATLSPPVVRMRLNGANETVAIEGRAPLARRVNYYVGADASRWRTDIATFGKVAYERVYDGIDLVYYGNDGQLEFDFIVAPGADPSLIRFTLADKDDNPLPLELDKAGDLLVDLQNRPLRLHRPHVYQEDGPRRRVVDGAYEIPAAASEAGTVRFVVGDYDRTKPLVLDPVISYSTYLGGTASDFAQDIAVDTDGNAYIAGFTASTDFPLAGALQSFQGASDAFISKLDASGTGLIYSTYLGGPDIDKALVVAVDRAGRAYLGGHARGNFPLLAPAQAAHAGNDDGFVAKLNTDGTLAYSTYLGGSQIDWVQGIAADASGNAYVTGQTQSIDFPVLNALQPSVASPGNAFVAKFSVNGALAYSTYFGGAFTDSGNGLALDAGGNPVIAGVTSSPDLPVTPGALQSTYGGGNSDAFIASINTAGTAWRYVTYFGGADFDGAVDIAVDPTGNPVITGNVFGSHLPVTANAAQPVYGGQADAFVAKLNSTGTKLLYSTYIGGSGGENGYDVAADAAGNVYVAGQVSSTDFPVRRAPQPTLAGNLDMHITKINTAGGPFLYATYWGGTEYDTASGIAVDAAGSAYVAGHTGSSNFPMVNALQGQASTTDAAIVKLAPAVDLQITKTATPNPVALGGLLTYNITVTNLEADAATNVIVADVLPVGTLLVSATPSQGTCAGTSKVACALGVVDNGSATIQLLTRPVSSNGGTITNTATIKSLEPDVASSNNSSSIATTTTGGFQLRVGVNTTAGGTVKSSPAGISCASDCVETYMGGAAVRLVAQPAVGYSFNYWTGSCSGPDPVCNLTMTASRSTLAVFSLIQ